MGSLPRSEFGKEPESAFIDAENRYLPVRKKARCSQKGAVSADNDDKVGLRDKWSCETATTKALIVQ
jgi:hypothetical protein